MKTKNNVQSKSGSSDFVAYLYSVSDDMPSGISFSERVIRAERKYGKFLDTEVANAKTEYFLAHPDAETWWSLVELRSNVCESVRGKEQSGENQSYKVKIENGLKLPALDSEIEKRGLALFKSDIDAKDAFTAGKRKAAKEIGTFEENMGDLRL